MNDAHTTWKCGECGAWVPMGFSRHVHFSVRQPSLEELIANRRLDEMHISADVSASAVADVTTTYWRTGREETQ